MSVKFFREVFRAEHREIRDELFDLLKAFESLDQARARSVLNRVTALVGPHFRYEEEALYPALEGLFGRDYIEKLLCNHDRAIDIARGLKETVSMARLDEETARQARKQVRLILAHMSNCHGAAIMMEAVTSQAVQSVLEKREKARNEAFDLLRWADHVRHQ